MKTSITQALAEFVAGSSADDTPREVTDMAALCLLDWFAATVAGSREPVADPLHRVARLVGNGDQASVIGSRHRYTAPWAAMLNGTFSHALELDDVHHGAAIHGSAVCWAAALAVAELTGAGAAETTAAFALGYEIMARIGLPCGQRMIRENHHPTGVLGYFGACATAGRLLGLDARQQAIAFGIAAGQAGALTHVRGTMSKPFFAGHSACGGVLSALLAQQGFLSAPDAIEGAQGVLNTFAPGGVHEMVVDALGTRWELAQNAFKVHASCAMSHALVDGVLDLRRQRRLTLRDVAEVRLRLYPHATEYLNRPLVDGGLAGKFSAQYCAAVALADGAAQEGQFSDERARDPHLASFMRQVALEPDPRHGLDQATVIITLHDGTRHEIEVPHVLGSPARPLSRAALEGKAGQLLARALPPARLERALRTLARWPECEVRTLFDLCVDAG